MFRSFFRNCTMAQIGNEFIILQSKCVDQTFHNKILNGNHPQSYNSNFYRKNPSCKILPINNLDFYNKNPSCENLPTYNSNNSDLYRKYSSCKNVPVYNSYFYCKNTSYNNLPIYNSGLYCKIQVVIFVQCTTEILYCKSPI